MAPSQTAQQSKLLDLPNEVLGPILRESLVEEHIFAPPNLGQRYRPTLVSILTTCKRFRSALEGQAGGLRAIRQPADDAVWHFSTMTNLLARSRIPRWLRLPSAISTFQHIHVKCRELSDLTALKTALATSADLQTVVNLHLTYTPPRGVRDPTLASVAQTAEFFFPAFTVKSAKQLEGRMTWELHLVK